MPTAIHVVRYMTRDDHVFDTMRQAKAHEKHSADCQEIRSALLKRVHARWPGTMSEGASFVKGFDTGRSWTWTHVPGGPFIFGEGSSWIGQDPEWVLMCEISCSNHRAWIRGWHAGFAQQGRPLKSPPHKTFAPLV